MCTACKMNTYSALGKSHNGERDPWLPLSFILVLTSVQVQALSSFAVVCHYCVLLFNMWLTLFNFEYFVLCKCSSVGKETAESHSFAIILMCDVFLYTPPRGERGEQDWYLQNKPHTSWCSTMQVKGPVVFRRKNVMHNVIMVSAEMELETHLMPLLGSLLKTKLELFVHCIAKSSSFQHLHAAEELLREQQVLLDPSAATPVPLCVACQDDTYLCSLFSLLWSVYLTPT